MTTCLIMLDVDTYNIIDGFLLYNVYFDVMLDFNHSKTGI